MPRPEAIARDVLVAALVLLRHPLLFVELLLIAGVLIFALGRSVGLPLIFWSEKASVQFIAGVGCNLLAAQVLFTSYLADTPHRIEWAPFATVVSIAWIAVQIAAVIVQASAHDAGRRKGERPKRTWLRRRSAGIRTMAGAATLGPLSSPAAAPWPFLGGAVAGGGIVAGFRLGGLWLVNRSVLPVGWVVKAGMRLEPLSGFATVSNPELHVLAALDASLLFLAFLGLRRRAPPALGICILLGLVAETDGAVAFWLHSPGLGMLVALLLLLWAGGQTYKVRLADLKAAYDRSSLRPYPPRVVLGASTSSLRADRLAEPPLPVDERPGPAVAGYDSKGRRPLVVICTSGGGIRAAAWTAAIMGQLDEDPNFRRHTWLVTGASGGMVGAAVWSTTSVGPRRVAWRDLMNAVGADSLSPVVRRLVFADVPGALGPYVDTDDRGTALQAQWCANVEGLGGLKLDSPLASLRAAEERGELPSLVFSPMLVEDGRRLLISNLDLAWTVANRVNWLTTDGSVESGIASVTAYHARDVLGAEYEKLTLATAARLSASFPYVSPAAQLPTAPPRRVVDAGYYDNYGVELACSWLQRCFEHNDAWLEEHVSGILVIQIRDGESELSPAPEVGSESPPPPPPLEVAAPAGRFVRALQGLTSPPEAVLAARRSVTLFRNDAQLHALRSLYATKFDPTFVATTIFELKADVSLSWALSRAELHLIAAQAESDGIADKLRSVKSWIAHRIR